MSASITVLPGEVMLPGRCLAARQQSAQELSHTSVPSSAEASRGKHRAVLFIFG